MVKSMDAGASFTKLMSQNYSLAPYSICVVLHKFMIEIADNFFGSKTNEFIEASKISTERERFTKFKDLINNLPQKNRNYLARYFKFFKRIISDSTSNKVNAKSIGVLFAPALIKTDDNNILKAIPKVFEIILINANLYFPKTLYRDRNFRDAVKEDFAIIERFNTYEEKMLLEAIKNKEIRVQIFGLSLKEIPHPIPNILEKMMCFIEKYCIPHFLLNQKM
jgi:hypothetical protein